VPQHPFARAADRLAVSQVQPWFQALVVGFAARPQPAAGGAGFQRGVPYRAGHVVACHGG
jgi:hypothetical protein